MNNYAENGYRLIAVAMVELKLSYVKAAKIAREKVANIFFKFQRNHLGHFL